MVVAADVVGVPVVAVDVTAVGTVLPVIDTACMDAVWASRIHMVAVLVGHQM